MEEKSAILLNEHFVNNLKVGGEPAYIVLGYNASTGYHWELSVDNSGTYELKEKLTMHPSVEGAVGVPGKISWKFEAINEGIGEIMVESFPPGSDKPVEKNIYKLKVVK
nr:protease inhibitor I42 family protein [uncultured Draconibacterium sp.]